MSERLVALAEVRPGQSVLDLATGIGEPAISAALRVGPGGRVIGVDQAPQMISLARRRMASLGLTNVEFQEGDVESLGLPDEAFDAVLSRWGLMFLPDLEGTLRRVLRALMPGGRLAAAVWPEPSRVPLLRLPGDVMRRELGLPPPAPDVPTPFALADVTKLGALLELAGFVDVRSEAVPVVFEFSSLETYVRFVQEVSRPIPELERQSGARRAEIWQRLGDAARGYERSDGTIAFPNETTCIVARRPAARQVACPFCHGTDTRLEAPFGSTLGFAQYWCESCRTVFEYLKWDDG